MSSIKVSELKTIFERIIEKLENQYGEDGELELKTGVYRLISTEKWDKFDKHEDWFSSSEIEQGDLKDDLSELKKLISQKERITTFVDFDRLASILREISQVENPIE
jgi:YesN/AraC family two-component response regulator